MVCASHTHLTLSMNPDFQQLLDQYEGQLTFKELKGKLSLSPDEFIYMIETDQGMYFVFETDDLYSFDYIVQQVKKGTQSFSHFIEAKIPPETFKETLLAEGYVLPNYHPSYLEEYKKYVSFGYGSFPGYATFLIKK